MGFNDKRETVSSIFEGVPSHHGRKKLAHNTYEYFVGDEKRIRFHRTDIIIFKGDCVRFDTGGWRTNTTKNRFNRFSPFRMYSDSGFWYVQTNAGKYAFRDGIVIDLKTGIAFDAPDYDATRKEFKATKKALAKYIADYVDLLASGKMEKPGAGDCFYCQINGHTNELVKTSTPAEIAADGGHIQSHIEEHYLVPSLIWAAFRAVGSAPIIKQYVYQAQFERKAFGERDAWIKYHIACNLKRYILQRVKL